MYLLTEGTIRFYHSGVQAEVMGYGWLIKPVELSRVHIKGYIEPESGRNNNWA